MTGSLDTEAFEVSAATHNQLHSVALELEGSEQENAFHLYPEEIP